MQKINNLKIFTLIISLIFFSACQEDDKANTLFKQNLQTVEYSTQAISLNNQGVGEMGLFDYAKATKTFEKLVAENKKWPLAQQNLAIALLNRQKPEDEEKAISIAQSLLTKNSDNLIAQYIIAILKFNQGLCEQALPYFESIMKADNRDAYAYYFAGQCHLQNGEAQLALDLYQKAIKADGYLRSAYYGSFMAAQRLAQTEIAKQMLDAYQKLAVNPKARLAEIKYTRMGPKANARAITVDSKELAIFSKAPYFIKPQLINGVENIQQFGIVNLNQTHQPQLYVVNKNTLYLYDNFTSRPQKLDSFTTHLNKGNHLLAWGDVNNDGKIDVYVTGSSDQLYIQSGKAFEAVNMTAFGLKGLSSKAVRVIDADHDGDLDLLLLSQTGQFEIWNNNLNNTFTALSNKTTLPTDDGYEKIIVQDIDADRDVDIVLLKEYQFTVLFNDRMWDYKLLNGSNHETEIKNIFIADNNINGLPELNLAFEDNKVLSLEFNHETESFKEMASINGINGQLKYQLDVNGDGLSEFTVLNSQGIEIYDTQGKLSESIVLDDIDAIKVLNTTQGPELMALKNHQLYYIAASENRMPYVLLDFSGKQDDANSVRSNYSGIGTHVVLHNESFYSTADTFQNGNGIDQDYQAISLATGTKNPLDFIELEWSDGVYQTELSLQASSYHRVTETQRQLSSCPVIFSWNNGKYEFVSDVLGVGGIGFALGRHEYGTPRSWENYLLTADQLEPDNGYFKLQFTEPMEESAYLDTIQIEVVDIPNEWSMTLDERMGISEPQVTGQAVYYQSIIKPESVFNRAGDDVTELALKTDKKAIELLNEDHRFLGLVDEQIITMEFEQELKGNYQFIFNGWVEYGYSQTMFAAWQAGQVAQAPTLEYQVNGQWKVLLEEFGYPAGMPRNASVPINIPEKTLKLRLRTNMEIYFDQLGLAQFSQPDSIIHHQISLHSAELKQLGFPQRKNNHQRVPFYDFSQIQPFWDTRYMQGAYTQLGEVTELLEHQDNALAIIGAGEGIEMKFTDDLPQLDEGYTRYFILKFKGWAKDMDILTKQGETLAPIPADGTISVMARELNEKYNNRYRAGK